MEDQLYPLKFLFGLQADVVFDVIYVNLPGWFLLAVAPRWQVTHTLVLVVAGIQSLVYALGVLSVLLYPKDPAGPAGSFDSLEGVWTLFQNPSFVMVGWLHYGAFDVMVAKWIVSDAVERAGASYTHIFHFLVMLPLLVLVMFLGPSGFFLYLVVRHTLLSGNRQSRKAHEDSKSD